jgi:alpha-ribazole phosphatase
MKKIYFVRHGQSEGNVGLIRQSPNSPLTQTGQKQANLLAERLSHLEFELLVSSPFKRTRQTAEIISNKTGKQIIESELFIERKRPGEQINQPKDSKDNIQSEINYNQAFRENKKYKDGESFEEIVQRAKDALDFLDKQPHKNITVITHGVFLRVICALVLLEDSITPENCFKMIMNLKTANTGVTVIEKSAENSWELITWNDHSHFAE